MLAMERIVWHYLLFCESKSESYAEPNRIFKYDKKEESTMNILVNFGRCRGFN